MRGKLTGSYTVEAAFVMAIVLWVLLFSIQAAYRVHDEVIGAMALGESAERLCHSETKKPEEAALTASRRAGSSFSWGKYRFQLTISKNLISGKKVKATGAGGKWKLSLEQRVFDPENFIRMLTLVDQEE